VGRGARLVEGTYGIRGLDVEGRPAVETVARLSTTATALTRTLKLTLTLTLTLPRTRTLVQARKRQEPSSDAPARRKNDSRLYVKLLVSNAASGSVIGKGGANIHQTQASTGT